MALLPDASQNLLPTLHTAHRCHHLHPLQVTEPVPLLAEEPVRGEPVSGELAALCRVFDKAEASVKVRPPATL